jgi:A/G-specific adenine glycosylase
MGNKVAGREGTQELRRGLLRWYERHRRDLPWRRTCDPYAIWVSEIMLQQTRVAAVVEKFQAFMARFPTLISLANAPEQEVLAQWSGLGYYRRARMLHKAAQLVVGERCGTMPETAAELRLLPGIGGYTSAAIASIAHGEPVAVVDGNVERVLCRLQGWDANGGKGRAVLRRRIEDLAAQLVDPKRPGDFNQAMMELGATVCLPRNPQCMVCPVIEHCKTRGEHRTTPRTRSVVRETAYALCLRTRPMKEMSAVLLEQRSASETVMPGLWELPKLKDEHALSAPRLTVRHAIMQTNYVVRVHDVRASEVKTYTVPGGYRRWIPLDEAAGMALTGLARKVLKNARVLPATVLAGLRPGETGA